MKEWMGERKHVHRPHMHLLSDLAACYLLLCDSLIIRTSLIFFVADMIFIRRISHEPCAELIQLLDIPAV